MQVLLTVPRRTGERGKAEGEHEEGGGDEEVQMKTPLPNMHVPPGPTDKKGKFCLRKSLPKFHV